MQSWIYRNDEEENVCSIMWMKCVHEQCEAVSMNNSSIASTSIVPMTKRPMDAKQEP